MTQGPPQLPGDTVDDSVGLGSLCKKPGGDGEKYGTKFVRPGGVLDERLLSGVRDRRTPLGAGGALDAGDIDAEPCPLACRVCGQPLPIVNGFFGTVWDWIGVALSGANREGRIFKGFDIVPVTL